jgi:hypothetical protein
MNRSYSKIRHIQESNLRLEKRTLTEALGGGEYDASSIDKIKAKYRLSKEVETLLTTL